MLDWRRGLFLALTALVGTAFVPAVSATPILYMQTGMLSGSLGRNPLKDVVFSFSFFADTANITGSGTAADPFRNVASSTAIRVGAERGSFSVPVEVGSNTVDGVIGFVAKSLPMGVTFAPARGLGGYSLGSSVSFSSLLPFFPSGGSIGTTFGLLTITDLKNLTFSATVNGVGPDVPEPATVAISGAGLLCIAWLRRKRKGGRGALR